MLEEGRTNVGHVNLATAAARGTTVSRVEAATAAAAARHSAAETTTVAAGGTDKSRLSLTVLTFCQS